MSLVQPLLHEEFSPTGKGKEEGNPRRNRMEESGLEINRGLVTTAKRRSRVKGDEHTPRRRDS